MSTMTLHSIINKLVQLSIEITGLFHAVPKFIEDFVEGCNQNGSHCQVIALGMSEVTEQEDLRTESVYLLQVLQTH